MIQTTEGSKSAAGELESSQRCQAILILGMHRSGTSALGGVINALGAAAPKTLMPPQSDNPRGFFESVALAGAHDDLLVSAGSSWHDWRHLDLLRCEAAVVEQHRLRIKAVLVEEFGDAPLIFIKDPRICRFVPLTLSILSELNVSPVGVLAVRNPLDVAHSLQRRNGFAISKSLLMWLRHVLEAEFYSRHLVRDIVPYEKFLINWRYYADRVSEKTGIVWPERSGGGDLEVDKFLSLDLRHEKAPPNAIDDHPEVTSLVRETYDILTSMAESGETKSSLDSLDSVRARFDDGCNLFRSMVAVKQLDVDRLYAEIAARSDRVAHFERMNARLASLLEQRSAEVDSLAAERDSLVAVQKSLAADRVSLISAHNNLVGQHRAVLASRSWRFTAPLRFVGRLFER